MPQDILSMNPSELTELMGELKQPAYRAGQVFDWLHRRKAVDFSEMNNLPKDLREKLLAACLITPCREAKKQVSKDGTEKYLFNVGGAFIESVLMSYKHGHSLCISTQAGCRMGCTFCASTIGGLVRNLTAGEMCAQVYQMPRRISSVVLMGCGEPLDNFDATLRFIELITHPKGYNLGMRHLTLSTCGLVPQMRLLAEMKLQINLAVSLHGTTDEIRRQFMPVTNKYPLAQLLDACRYYASTTRRRITFEYTLANGVNDAPNHAQELSVLLKGMLCHVNLIPINAAASAFAPSTRHQGEAFAEILTQQGIPVTIRRSLGEDISAACGQLRAGVSPHH